MIVGDDVAPGIDDEAGAERLLHLVTLIAPVLSLWDLAAEEAIEEVLEVVVALSLTLLLVVLTFVAGIL